MLKFGHEGKVVRLNNERLQELAYLRERLKLSVINNRPDFLALEAFADTYMLLMGSTPKVSTSSRINTSTRTLFYKTVITTTAYMKTSQLSPEGIVAIDHGVTVRSRKGIVALAAFCLDMGITLVDGVEHSFFKNMGRSSTLSVSLTGRERGVSAKKSIGLSHNSTADLPKTISDDYIWIVDILLKLPV